MACRCAHSRASRSRHAAANGRPSPVCTGASAARKCRVSAHRIPCVANEPLDPIAHARPIVTHRVDLPRQLPRRFRLRRRHVHHTPHLPLARRPSAAAARSSLPRVQPIGLRPPRPAIHLDARRIDHHIRDALRAQPPMQPEAIPARLHNNSAPARRRGSPNRALAVSTSARSARRSPAAIVRTRGRWPARG